MAIHLHQIFYDEATKRSLDPAFLPLDNSNPVRSDWYQYWPMRSIILNNSFADTDYVGFFSSRFQEKTGITGAQVRAIVGRSTAEVLSFSSLFVEIARRQNIFVQGELFHPDLLDVSRDTLEAIGLGLDLKNLWQDQTRTVYSNYFVARYRFWKRWFEFSEKIFAIAEENSPALSQKLNSFAPHRETSDRYQMKIFIMERLVCALLEKLNMNATATFNFRHQRKEYNQAMKVAGKEPLDFSQFFLLDALKGQYLKTGQASFLNLYHHINTPD